MVSKPPACGSIEGSNTEHEKSGTKATDATLSRAKLDTIKDTEAISTDCPGTNPIAYDAVKIPRKPSISFNCKSKSMYHLAGTLVKAP